MAIYQAGLPLTLVLTFICAGALPARAADEAPPPPLVEAYLEKGDLDGADAALSKVLEQNPADQQARFSLGVVRALQAIEHLGQSFYHYGLLQSGPAQMATASLPLLRMPIPKNPQPQPMSYEDGTKLMESFLAKLADAEAVLAQVDAKDVKLPLHFGRIRLDLNGDGQAEEDEALWKLLARVVGNIGQAAGENFLIVFDGGDVHWLRGYCHLLSGICEMALAYDGRELFERTGHLYFAQVDSPYPYLQEEKTPRDRQMDWIFDAIATIHLINFPVVAPERSKAALAHFEAMVEQSRQSWKLILDETDDDHEWIPNPQQTGVLPNIRVRAEMVESWQKMLDEMAAILKGEKLVPFWRGNPRIKRRGVNLRRVFTEPRRLDLVMWVSGTGADPYLEEGELTDARTWRRLLETFRGNFFGFAIWFN